MTSCVSLNLTSRDAYVRQVSCQPGALGSLRFLACSKHRGTTSCRFRQTPAMSHPTYPSREQLPCKRIHVEPSLNFKSLSLTLYSPAPGPHHLPDRNPMAGNLVVWLGQKLEEDLAQGTGAAETRRWETSEHSL